MQLLYGNAATLPKPQEGGHHGNIGIIMKLTLYSNLSTTVWINPPGLVVYPTVPTNSTITHQYQLQLHHGKGHIIYDNAGMMDEEPKGQLIDSVEDMYLKELKNEYTVFLRVTCCDILSYLIICYRNIMTTDLNANN